MPVGYRRGNNEMTKRIQKLKIIKNPDAAIYKEVTEAVKANDGYCPCLIEKSQSTKCPCEEFRKSLIQGQCHCGRYIKILT